MDELYESATRSPSCATDAWCTRSARRPRPAAAGAMMLGREIGEVRAQGMTGSPVARHRANRCCAPRLDSASPAARGVPVGEARRGRGLGGLLGSGRSETAKAIAGRCPRTPAGSSSPGYGAGGLDRARSAPASASCRRTARPRNRAGLPVAEHRDSATARHLSRSAVDDTRSTDRGDRARFPRPCVLRQEA